MKDRLMAKLMKIEHVEINLGIQNKPLELQKLSFHIPVYPKHDVYDSFHIPMILKNKLEIGKYYNIEVNELDDEQLKQLENLKTEGKSK